MEVGGRRVEPEDGDVTESGDICQPCQRGSAITVSVGLCRECEEHMCQTCFDNHLKVRICINHSLVDDLTSSGTFEDVERCKQHDNEIIKYYCRKHETVGCGDCMFSGGHNACKPENIKHLAKNFRNDKEYTDLVKQLDDIETDTNLTEGYNHDCLRKIQELSEKAVNDVRKFRTDVNNFLDNAEANIISKIKTVTSENHEQMATMEKAIEGLSSELEEVRQKLSRELHDGNVLFINAIGCKPQLKRLAQSLANEKSKKVLKNFAFFPDEDLKRIVTSTKSLGNIRASYEDREKRVQHKTEENSSACGQTYAAEQIQEDCLICGENIKNPKTLMCGHRYCCECIDAYFTIKQTCPTCGVVCVVLTGDQPEGNMIVNVIKHRDCAGYEGCGQIIIQYDFPSGKQAPNHPNPGKPYKGISRTAYLPNNKEGRMKLAMLKVAFERRLVFTIGTSRTTGQRGVITWNDVRHKTDPRPNSQHEVELVRAHERRLVHPVQVEPEPRHREDHQGPQPYGDINQAVSPPRRAPTDSLTHRRKAPVHVLTPPRGVADRAVAPPRGAPVIVVTPPRKDADRAFRPPRGDANLALTPPRRAAAQGLTPPRRSPVRAVTPPRRSSATVRIVTFPWGDADRVVTPPRSAPVPVVTPPRRGADRVVTPPRGSANKIVNPPRRAPDRVVTPPRGGANQVVNPSRRAPGRVMTPPRGGANQVLNPPRRAPVRVVTPPRRGADRVITPPRRAPPQVVTPPRRDANQAPRPAIQRQVPDRRDDVAAGLSSDDEANEPPRRRRRLADLIRENNELYNNFMRNVLPRMLREYGIDLNE